ncbi:MAG TPA: hypothetical protein VNK96_03270 [Fimbriimonadales bacterium]|nr:hypothetical protein [Fimbriimonadales bacterium]
MSTTRLSLKLLSKTGLLQSRIIKISLSGFWYFSGALILTLAFLAHHVPPFDSVWAISLFVGCLAGMVLVRIYIRSDSKDEIDVPTACRLSWSMVFWG